MWKVYLQPWFTNVCARTLSIEYGHGEQDQASARAIIISLILISLVRLLLLFWVYFVYKTLMPWVCLDECMMLKILEYFRDLFTTIISLHIFFVFDCVYSHYLNSNVLFVFGFSMFNILSNDRQISAVLYRAHARTHMHSSKQVHFLPIGI